MSLRPIYDWERSPELAKYFNRLVDHLTAEEAVAMGAHYALGVPYAKVAQYLRVSPRRAKNLASTAIKKLQYLIRIRNELTEFTRFNNLTSTAITPRHITGIEAAACPLIVWLAGEFGVHVAWSPFDAWVIELFSGVETRPCQHCGDALYFASESRNDLTTLGARFGRPRLYCSDACRQATYRSRLKMP